MTTVPGPGQAVAATPAGGGEPEPAAPERQCGRCRGLFPDEPGLHPVALREWWLCPSCYEALLAP